MTRGNCGLESLEKTVHYQMKVEDLGRAVFLQNKHNATIVLNAPNAFRDAKDLFCFLFELFCRGLAILYGTQTTEGNNLFIDIEEILQGQIAHVAERMSYLGFEVHCDSLPDSDPQFEGWFQKELPWKLQMLQVMQRNIQLQTQAPDNQPLEHYKYYIKIREFIHVIHFTIRRVL